MHVAFLIAWCSSVFIHGGLACAANCCSLPEVLNAVLCTSVFVSFMYVILVILYLWHLSCVFKVFHIYAFL
jgi:hypothetical protein